MPEVGIGMYEALERVILWRFPRTTQEASKAMTQRQEKPLRVFSRRGRRMLSWVLGSLQGSFQPLRDQSYQAWWGLYISVYQPLQFSQRESESLPARWKGPLSWIW